MKKDKIIILSILVLIAVILLFTGFSCLKSDEKNTIHIAMVGPMTGDYSQVGRSFRQGINLYLERVNKRGGINGKKIILDEFDDKNNKDEAEEQARQIVDQNKAVAVIGHHYSSCSISGGKIYENNGIPAISPASTNVKVTDSKWYFRSSFNDNLQGRFLANFAKRISKNNVVSIIAEDDPYGAYIAKVFEDTAKSIDLEVKYRWDFRINDKEIDEVLNRIIGELQLKKDAGIIFLSTHAAEGVKLVRLLKDNYVKNPVMAPDAFASESFQKGFEDLPKEKRSPGFYTDGMYVTTPLIFDMMGEKGLTFKDAYTEKYGEEPGWHAAFSYDTAMVVVEAIRNTEITGDRKKIKEEREKIRNFLANLTELDDAIEGVTGYNYFDEKGDSQKPIFVGVYQNQKIISALTQFRGVPDVADIPNLKEEMEKERVVFFDGKYSYKVNVVYTGIEINEISDLDIDNFICTLDFHIWFRYQGQIDVQSIEFLNSVEAIQLGAPALEKGKDQINYRLYHVKGKFRTDFLPNQYMFGHHLLGVSLRPRALNRNNLIFVKDVLSMPASSEALTKKMKDGQVLNPIYGWTIKDVLFFQDITEKNSLGDPEYLSMVGGILEYSRFNVGIQITKDKFNLRKIPVIRNPEWSWRLVWVTLGLSILFLLWVKGKMFVRHIPILKMPSMRSKILWFFQFPCTFIFLLCAEVYLLNRLSEDLGNYYLEILIMSFNSCWWLGAAFFLNLWVKRFIWIPVEEHTNRKIPDIVRHLVALGIYLLAIFGVIAFVLDQKLTSLLATSGVIAMIVGLAVQMNIANIFSGIAINIERPFQIDDWIKIGEFTEGKVKDINWRATRIQTRDGSVLTIPNSQASESSIENFTLNGGYWKYTTVHVDPSHSPERVKKVLLDAAMATPDVCNNPPPSTRFLGLTAGITGQSESWAANYLVSTYFKDYGGKFAHNEAVWTSIWNHLKYAGIRHIIERQEVHMIFEGIKKRKEESISKPFAILQEIDIFQPFSDESKEYLSSRMGQRYFPQGEIVVREGDKDDSLFIVVEGTLGVWVKDKNDPSKSIEVARIGAGNFFGEMALLTGEPRAATIIAASDTYAFEITKKDIFPLIQKQPQISYALSDVLTERKIKTQKKLADVPLAKEEKVNLAAQILKSIQAIFGSSKK